MLVRDLISDAVSTRKVRWNWMYMIS